MLAERDFDAINPHTYRIYGTCYLSKAPIYTTDAWKLEWVWLHPFFRHRGYFKEHSEFLEKEYGNFFIKNPLSSDMKKNLEKVENHSVIS